MRCEDIGEPAGWAGTKRSGVLSALRLFQPPSPAEKQPGVIRPQGAALPLRPSRLTVNELRTALPCSGQSYASSFGPFLRELQQMNCRTFCDNLNQRVKWLCDSYVLKRQGSLCNLKLLAEKVGYGVSAPAIKFFYSKKGKVLSSLQCQGSYIQRAQHSSCGHRTAQCVALNQTSPHICIWRLANHTGTLPSALGGCTVT